mgnify:CR=1 FL=1
MGAVSAVTDFVSDVVDTTVDVVSDAGSFIDDTVRDVVPGGWATVAAVVTMNPELVGLEGATAAGTDYLGSMALGDATTGAVGSGATGFGINAGAAGVGIDTAAGAALASELGGLGETATTGFPIGDQIGDFPLEGSFGNPTAPGVQEATENLLSNNVLQETAAAPLDSIGDQPGDFPTEGSYGNPTAPGVQDATQNLLSNNVLQETAGAPLDSIGDQPGDFPTEGSYGDPTAPGVKDAVQNLLDYNAQYATPGLSLTDATRIANQFKNFLTGTPGSLTGGLTTGLTGGTSVSALPETKLDFTPHMTKGSQISLVGMPDFQETYTQTTPMAAAPSPQLENVQFAATGGLIQSFGDGGAPVSLDPRFTKGRKVSPSTFYGNLFPLTSPQIGMPTFKAYNEGGEVVDHKPQFYSEGGLGTLKNRYVKGPGDGTSDSVPAMLANGEFVIPADVVSKLGNGSNDSGSKVLDEFMRTIREHKRRADARHLPPDSKGPLSYLQQAQKKVKV